MKLRMLERLDEDGRAEPSGRCAYPGWDVVEAAIRQLDRVQHSGVRLHMTWAEAWDESGCDEPAHALSIWGGGGEYALMVTLPGKEGSGHRTLRFVDPTRVGTGERVNLLEGLEPDGYFATADERCSSLADVLAIARHFAETGEPMQRFTWQQEP
jgi:hypothetical protein